MDAWRVGVIKFEQELIRTFWDVDELQFVRYIPNALVPLYNSPSMGTPSSLWSVIHTGKELSRRISTSSQYPAQSMLIKI
jgi:hypothetical protein